MTWAVGHPLSKQKVKKLEFSRFFFNYALPLLASACGSANGKVKRRRRDGGNGAGAERPSPCLRRKHADHSVPRDAARDERAFCGTEQVWSSGEQGRPLACEVKHKSALVTAKANVCFPNHQFTAVGNDTAFFSYSSRLGNFILARFA